MKWERGITEDGFQRIASTRKNADYGYAEALAEKLVGNWQNFKDFSWSGAPDENSENWTVVYTENRDSDLMEKANAKAIDAIMSKFPEDQVKPERHSHWAVGYVDGYSIRVYEEDGSLTPAFQAWADIQERLEDYPILDESGLSEMESEALIENIKDSIKYNAKTDDDLVQDYLDNMDEDTLAYDFRDWLDKNGIDTPSEYYPGKQTVQRWLQEEVVPKVHESSPQNEVYF